MKLCKFIWIDRIWFFLPVYENQRNLMIKDKSPVFASMPNVGIPGIRLLAPLLVGMCGPKENAAGGTVYSFRNLISHFHSNIPFFWQYGQVLLYQS